MPHYDNRGDAFASSSQFLSPSTTPPRKSPSRQSINNRRSTSSLRGSSTLAQVIDDETANGRHSLAHELAVALMPEPSASSKLLAEEFGIEYDEGAKGIDEDVHSESGLHIVVDDAPPFADELASEALDSSFHNNTSQTEGPLQDFDPVFERPTNSTRQKKQKRLEQDAMQVLAQDLASTDKFLSHLRHLDVDCGSSVAQQPALEKIASDVIRRINETARDREGQVRELLEYEREFRRIAGQVGGSDLLSQLDKLVHVADLSEAAPSADVPRSNGRPLDVVEEESNAVMHLSHPHDWEMDLDRHRLGDEDDDFEPVSSPIKDSFPLPPPVKGPPTPATTIPQLADLRSFTTSLVASLATISEQAQVNGAATTEAGRKIRALKNKLGGWRTDWDNAERSRLKIEKWEAGIVDGGEAITGGIGIPLTPTSAAVRIDGRKFVEEHLQAFELVLADAAVKTKAIMASRS